jgi:phosphoribosylanthranilate isomerase
VWRAFRGPVTQPVEDAEAILLDSPKTGVPFDWRSARGAAERVIVAGGLDALNVAEAIRIAEPWGVDASSRLESSPGIKDHAKVRDFVKAAFAACEVHR